MNLQSDVIKSTNLSYLPQIYSLFNQIITDIPEASSDLISHHIPYHIEGPQDNGENCYSFSSTIPDGSCCS